MLLAARSVLSSRYQITGQLPLYTTGYSEGGSYALEAAHLMQSNPLYAPILEVELREAVPISGAFDLSHTMVPYMFDNISAAHNTWFSRDPVLAAETKPYLSAYVALAFASYADIPPTDILVDPFYNCVKSAPCGNPANLDGLYFNTNFPDGEVLLAALTQALNAKWTPADNPVSPLLTPAYATALIHADMNNPLYRQVVAADTYNFVPSFPVTIVSLMEDSIVTRRNSDVAFAYFEKHNPGGPYHEFLVPNGDFFASGQPVDHETELPFLAVLALNQFNITE